MPVGGIVSISASDFHITRSQGAKLHLKYANFDHATLSRSGYVYFLRCVIEKN